MKTVVLDTDVIVTALRSPTGASSALLQAVVARQLTAVASVPLMIEYEAKCLLPEHYLAAGITREQALWFIDNLALLMRPVTNHFLWRPILNDPYDEMVLETAVNGRADSIVTFNLRDYRKTPPHFNIEIMTPQTAMRRIQ